MSVKLYDINGCANNHVPCLLAVVVMSGKKYMALQSRSHEIIPGTWDNPTVARIPMEWTMDRLLSSGDGVCEAIWWIVAQGQSECCEIIIDDDEIKSVMEKIEEADK